MRPEIRFTMSSQEFKQYPTSVTATSAKRRVVAFTIGGLLWGGMPAYYGVTQGIQAAEKVATRLAMPMGCFWSLLILIGLIAWTRGSKAVAITCCSLTIILTALGNGWIANNLAIIAEQTIVESSEDAQTPFDAVILLGGSTRMSPSGQPELSWDGQRLLTAAQLYHSGKVKRILATGGKPVFEVDKDAHAQQAKQILESIGVPSSAITLSGGKNTREELEQLQGWYNQLRAEVPNARVGIIASAAHLNRAMEQARHLRLRLIPISCLRTEPTAEFPLFAVIPSVGALSANTDACYELLAGFVGH